MYNYNQSVLDGMAQHVGQKFHCWPIVINPIFIWFGTSPLIISAMNVQVLTCAIQSCCIVYLMSSEGGT